MKNLITSILIFISVTISAQVGEFYFGSNLVFITEGSKEGVVVDVSPYVKHTFTFKTKTNPYAYIAVPLFYGVGVDLNIDDKLDFEFIGAYDQNNIDMIMASSLRLTTGKSLSVSGGIGVYLYHNIIFEKKSFPIIFKLSYLLL